VAGATVKRSITLDRDLDIELERRVRPWRSSGSWTDAHEVAPLDRERARHAASLLRRTRTTDIPGAVVAVEALHNAPSIMITSGRQDIRRLLDADEAGRGVVVWQV
jgi:hypothetical protein